MVQVMEPTRQDAEAMLKGAGGIESAVRARAPQEHPLYFATGLVYVLVGLLFDLGGGNSGAAVAVTVLGVLVLAVMAGTHVPYWLRYRQVRNRRTPKWLEWALAAWGAVRPRDSAQQHHRLRLHPGGRRGSRAEPAVDPAASA